MNFRSSWRPRPDARSCGSRELKPFNSTASSSKACSCAYVIFQAPKVSKAAAVSVGAPRFKKLKEAQILSWEEGEAEHKGLKIVVLKNAFDPAIDFAGTTAATDAFERKLEHAIAGECERCGELEKLTLYASHPAGVMIARFKRSYDAEKCVTHAATGEWVFNGRRISAMYWDGEENFERVRDYSEDAARVDQFGSWLEDQDPEAHLTELDKQQLHQTSASHSGVEGKA